MLTGQLLPFQYNPKRVTVPTKSNQAPRLQYVQEIYEKIKCFPCIEATILHFL